MLGEIRHAWGLCWNRAAVYLVYARCDSLPQLWETIVFASATRDHPFLSLVSSLVATVPLLLWMFQSGMALLVAVLVSIRFMV